MIRAVIGLCNAAILLAIAVLVLGILSFFTVPVILGPMAWGIGAADLREMRAGRMDPEGEGMTNAGRVLGMIMTLICLTLTGLMCLWITALLVLSFLASAHLPPVPHQPDQAPIGGPP